MRSEPPVKNDVGKGVNVNTRPRIYSRLRFPKELLHGKTGELTFRRHGTAITAQGEFMVSGPNADGLCEVLFQYLDAGEGKWVRLFLGNKYVDSLVFPANTGEPIRCDTVLEGSFEIEPEG